MGDDAYKQLRISIAEEDALSYRPLVGHPVQLRMRGSVGSRRPLDPHHPPGQQDADPPGLVRPFGGPLAVTKVGDPDAEDDYELTLPRFTAMVELPRAGCAEHHAGEFGYVTIRPDQAASMAQEVTRRVRRWIEDKLNRAKARAGTQIRNRYRNRNRNRDRNRPACEFDYGSDYGCDYEMTTSPFNHPCYAAPTSSLSESLSESLSTELPAELAVKLVAASVEAEPRVVRVPRQSLGTRKRTGDGLRLVTRLGGLFALLPG